jgi:hypothetical protein
MVKFKHSEMVNRWKSYPQTVNQLRKYTEVLLKHPEAVALIVSDEKTGKRFGNAKKRVGQCIKIGYVSGSYQIWASWADSDM